MIVIELFFLWISKLYYYPAVICDLALEWPKPCFNSSPATTYLELRAVKCIVVKNLPANAGDTRNVGLIPGMGSSPRGGYGDPLQYSWLKDPMDRGAWRAIVPGVSKSWTCLKWLSVHVVSHYLLKLAFPKFRLLKAEFICLFFLTQQTVWTP